MNLSPLGKNYVTLFYLDVHDFFSQIVDFQGFFFGVFFNFDFFELFAKALHFWSQETTVELDVFVLLVDERGLALVSLVLIEVFQATLDVGHLERICSRGVGVCELQ